MKCLKNGKYSFDEKDVLGSGAFGKVFRGYNHQQSYYVALKQITLQKLQFQGDELREIICSEITVMRKFSRKLLQIPCPYLVANQDCFRTEKYIYIIMELCQGGTLLQYTYGKKIPQLEAVSILYQIVEGVKYLADLGIVHRDLKPENIFVKKQIVNGIQRKLYKIGDFGFAAQKKTLLAPMGTYPYMAPEVYKKEEYGIKADVWAIGVIAHQILFAEIYFIGKDKWEIAKNIKQKPYTLTESQKQLISKETEDFIQKCLLKDQYERITIQQMANHSIFSNFKDKIKAQKKITVVEDIYNLVQKCQNLYKCAQLFANYSYQSKRQTEFVQIYLVKQSYINLNRLNYSIIYRQNHLAIPQQDFNFLLNKVPTDQYQKMSQTVQQECALVTNVFRGKYKEFMQYVQRFSVKDQELVKKLINEEPYTPVNSEVFREEVTKWVQVFKQDKTCHKLFNYCLELLS